MMTLDERAGSMLQVCSCLATLAAILAKIASTHWRMMSCKCVYQLSHASYGMTIASDDCYGASAEARTI